MSQRIVLSIVLFSVMLIAAACSPGRPLPEPPTATLPATAEVTPAQPPDTKPPEANPPEANPPSPTPTVPPVAPATSVPTQTPNPTVTPTATATKRPTLAATRRPISSGPLTFNYETVGIQGLSDGRATLTLRVIAVGGSGRYSYFHDDIKQAGATFDVPGHCGKPFVHTIKVTSTDGQSVSQSYFIGGVCPTLTPTP